MKGILAALLLVLLAVVLAIVLTPARTEDDLERPEAEPAGTQLEPGAAPEEVPLPALLDQEANGKAAPPPADPGVPIRGKVVDQLGEGISGAWVLTPSDVRDSTDETGAFEVFVPEPGPVDLRISHRAYLNTTSTAHAPSEDAVIILDRGLSVSGRASFPDGKPAPEIWVQTSDMSALASTGEDGRYELAGLAPGTLEVQCHAAGEKHSVEAGATEVNFTLTKHVVRLRFQDEEGQPVLEGTLQVTGTIDGENVYSLVGRFGSEGVQQLDRVRAGVDLEISLSTDGYDTNITSVSIDGEPRFHDVEIVMPREGAQGTLDLRVLDDEGAPRTHAAVSLRTKAGTFVNGYGNTKIELDGDGRTRLSIPVGSYQLKVTDRAEYSSLDGYALPNTTKIEVIAGETLPVEVVVRTGGRIRFTVQNADGEPVAARTVQLLDSEGQRIRGWFLRIIEGGWTTDLDEPGPVVREDPLPPGRYRLRLVRDQATVVEREVDVARGEVTEVELQLPRR